MSSERSQTPEEIEARRLLQALERVPRRDPERAAKTRARFLAEVETSKPPVTDEGFFRLKEWLRPSGRPQFRFRTLTIALVFVFFLLGGAGATAYASQQALPGDSLYGVKLWLEGSRLAFSLDDTHDLELHLRFAQERVDEIRVVLSGAEAANYEDASRNFTGHIEAAGLLLEELGQPESYSGRLAEILSAYNALYAEEEPDGLEEPDRGVEETLEPEETDSPETEVETPETEDSGESQGEREGGETQENDGEKSSGSEEEHHEEYGGTDDSTDEEDDHPPDETDEPDDS